MLGSASLWIQSLIIIGLTLLTFIQPDHRHIYTDGETNCKEDGLGRQGTQMRHNTVFFPFLSFFFSCRSLVFSTAPLAPFFFFPFLPLCSLYAIICHFPALSCHAQRLALLALPGPALRCDAMPCHATPRQTMSLNPGRNPRQKVWYHRIGRWAV